MKRSFLKDVFEDGPKAKIFIIDLIQENPDLWKEVIPEEWLDPSCSDSKQVHTRDGRTTKTNYWETAWGQLFSKWRHFLLILGKKTFSNTFLIKI